MWSKVTSSMIGQWISRYFSVETTKHSLALGYGYYWKVQILSSTTVQVRRLYVAWFSRYSCFSSFLLIHVMMEFSIIFINKNLSPGSYHCDEYGRAFWLVASAFIVKFGRQLLQKYSCERATATKDGTRCGGKRMHRYRDGRSSHT